MPCIRGGAWEWGRKASGCRCCRSRERKRRAILKHSLLWWFPGTWSPHDWPEQKWKQHFSESVSLVFYCSSTRRYNTLDGTFVGAIWYIGMARSESRAHVEKSVQRAASTRPGVTNVRAKKGHCSATRRSTLKSTSDQPRNPSLVWNSPRHARHQSFENSSRNKYTAPLVIVYRPSPITYKYATTFNNELKYYRITFSKCKPEQNPDRLLAEEVSRWRSRCRPRRTQCSTDEQCLRRSVDRGSSVQTALPQEWARCWALQRRVWRARSRRSSDNKRARATRAEKRAMKMALSLWDGWCRELKCYNCWCCS